MYIKMYYCWISESIILAEGWETDIKIDILY